MPLSILVPLVIVGLLLVYLSVRYWGGSGIERPLDEETVRNRLAVDFPAFAIDKVMLTDKGLTAFATGQDESTITMVHAIGQNHLTRLLDNESLAAIEPDDNGILLRLRDFTLSSLYVNVNDEVARENLVRRLEAIIGD